MTIEIRPDVDCKAIDIVRFQMKAVVMEAHSFFKPLSFDHHYPPGRGFFQKYIVTTIDKSLKKGYAWNKQE